MKKRIMSLVTAFFLLLSLVTVASAAGNGDGATPFNLQWKDKARGIISFEKQTANLSYRVNVYCDGKLVSGSTVGDRAGKLYEEVNLSDNMSTSGTYTFTIHTCSPPGVELVSGETATSEPFVYTAPATTLGAPTNLRFEVEGDKVLCVWDAPANWVKGRDLFVVDVTNKSDKEGGGKGTRSVPMGETSYEVVFSNFGPTEYNSQSDPHGTYTFAVRAISGDMTANRSADDYTEGTSTYSHPSGTIKNPAGTAPAAPATPAPAAKTALMRTQSITIDGGAVSFQAYALKDEKGNETNYVKLRDVAAKLNGTSVQFNVGWSGAVNIETGKAYLPNGTEMITPFSGDRAYTDATAPTNVNGAASTLAAIVLTDDKGAGYTYYKLRDLGTALGFVVDWNAKDGITVSTGGAPATVGKIEHPAVTDPTLTAPTDLKLKIGTRTEYGSGGNPVELPTTMPVIAWTNTAGERANNWIIQLYDQNNNRLVNTYFSGNPTDLAYMISEETAITISTITVTPVDKGADGYVSSGDQSDDKVGVTTEFKCKVTVNPKAGTAVTLTTAPTEWSAEDLMVTMALPGAPFGFAMLYSETFDQYGSTGRGGRSFSADESGKFQATYSVDEVNEQFHTEGAKIEFVVYSDAAVVNDTTGSYTVTIHPVTVQK